MYLVVFNRIHSDNQIYYTPPKGEKVEEEDIIKTGVYPKKLVFRF